MRDEKHYFVYIMANKPWGTLYVGVSGDLQSRVHQHRNCLIAGFTKTYGLKTLVYFEEHETATSAIHREKRLKKWRRAWKINLIRTGIRIGGIWLRTGTLRSLRLH